MNLTQLSAKLDSLITFAAPTAVIIKGNPRWVRNNPAADRLYGKIAKHLESKGYKVTMHHGHAYTQPRTADVWIAHSRGNDRLRFAPKGTKTLDLTPYERTKQHIGIEPTPSHYHYTKAMREQVDRITQ